MLSIIIHYRAALYLWQPHKGPVRGLSRAQSLIVRRLRYFIGSGDGRLGLALLQVLCNKGRSPHQYFMHTLWAHFTKTHPKILLIQKSFFLVFVTEFHWLTSVSKRYSADTIFHPFWCEISNIIIYQVSRYPEDHLTVSTT